MPQVKSPKPITWLDVLNEQTTWQTRQDFLNWFSTFLGHKAALSDSDLAEFENTLRFIREQLGALHFSKSIDVTALNQRLQNVTVQVSNLSSQAATAKARLPAFRAHKEGSKDKDHLTALRDSLLLQFAEAVGRAIDSNFENLPVSRCEGLYKRSVEGDISEASAYSPVSETRWRAEIPLLQESDTEAEDLLRCADFFIKTPKGRFCSDACRFTTFQIAKQLQDPDYLAEKQRRYRSKQTKTEPTTSKKS